MAKVVVIGASSLIGSYFIDNNFDYELICFSRNNKNYNYLDLKDENTFSNFSYKDSFLVSFAPIWLTANLISFLEEKKLDILKSLKGIIVFSSTSATTKRFAANDFDKKLSKKILYSENKILTTCDKYTLNCRVIRPTIIYGVYKELDDSNFSQIIRFFNRTPFCLVPNRTGYRQPIHFSQLSKLTNIFLNLFNNNYESVVSSKIIEVGGDEELSYKELLSRLLIVSSSKARKKCILIALPNKIFMIIISPLLIFRPKLFEALYRMQSDLSGFKKYCDYSGEKPQNFPIGNFDIMRK